MDNRSTGRSTANLIEEDYGPLGSQVPKNEVPLISPLRSYVATSVLFFINLLNYMDRYLIAGVLKDIQKYFDINDSSSGLLQTVFIFSYMLLAPLFGYLGDRYNRKLLMCVGILLWCIVTLASSFITQNYFWLLLLTRAIVGIGEASYSTIAPTIIGDFFVGTKRTWMLSIFYIAIPVGSGLGYIMASSVNQLAGDWHWALRVTPCLGSVALVMLIFLVPNPTRGASECPQPTPAEKSSFKEDLKYLLHNCSFIWSSMGTTAVSFVTGALAFWTPVYLSRAQLAQGQQGGVEYSDTNSLIFGGLTCVTGVLGVVIGAEASRRLKSWNPRIDPLICAFGMFSSSSCLYLAIVLAKISRPTTFIFIFFAETFMALNYAIVADILLYVVVPTRRSMAEAIQITICHALGDAGSPYLIGISTYWDFVSLEYAFLICPFVGILGGAFFLMNARHIEADRQRAAQHIQGDHRGDRVSECVRE
uniref:SPNS lysolipid transporter 3, sphingosine-1-phosphate (putative) n=1 Tax=Callorhinchus milii TaxID=7868 RepID=A0A4W3K151_CALMI